MKKYSADSIEALEGLEGVRDNPAMYLGDIGPKGTFHLFKEVFDNARDELVEVGGVREILVDLTGERVLVADTGRGIPVERHKKARESALTVVMTRLHAGAKGRGKSAYGKRTVGVHGVGAAVVNALSATMQVWTRRDGKWWTQAYAKGKALKAVATGKCPVPKWTRGTVVAFERDASIMKSALDKAAVLDYVKLQAHLHEATVTVVNGAKRVVVKPRPFRALIAKSDSAAVTPFVEVRTPDVRFVGVWREQADARVSTYVNGSPTAGGTHARALTEALRAAFVKAMGKRAGSFDPEIGLHAVLDVSIDRPKFEGQAKDRLASPEARALVNDALVRAVAAAVKRESEKFADVAERSQAVAEALEEGKQKAKLRSKTRDKKGGKSNLPIKLADADPGTKPHDRELYLLEGDSAEATAKQAKLANQATLPLRGKLPNLVRDARKAVTNREVLDIVTCCGYNSSKPDSPLRIGKLLLLADADVDGDHVSVLMLTAIYKTMPELLRDGRVYLVEGPLYQSKVGGKFVYGDSLAEMRKKGAKHVKRVKGWGGCNAEQLRELAFDPGTRRIRRVLPPKDEDRRPFEHLMGKTTEARKELVSQ